MKTWGELLADEEAAPEPEGAERFAHRAGSSAQTPGHDAAHSRRSSPAPWGHRNRPAPEPDGLAVAWEVGLSARSRPERAGKGRRGEAYAPCRRPRSTSCR